MALQYFMRNQWTFLNKAVVDLEELLLPDDVEDFGYDRNSDYMDVWTFFRNATLGGRKYLLKEDDSTLEGARRHAYKMWWLHKVFGFLWYLGVFYIVFFQIDLIAIILKKYRDMCLYFMSD